MDAQNYTSLVLPMVEADVLLRPFRNAHVLTPAVTLPAHITLVAPFTSPEDIDSEMLASLSALFRSFFAPRLSFHDIGRFEKAEVLFLAPIDPAPLYELSKRILALRPAGFDLDKHTFHLTLAHRPFSLDIAEQAFRQGYESLLPFTESIDRAELYSKTRGQWTLTARFPFNRERATNCTA
jgi:2'-5' RNA ligase